MGPVGARDCMGDMDIDRPGPFRGAEATMAASRKNADKNATPKKDAQAKNDDLPDPIEGRPDDAEPEYPRRNTEQVRDKQPGTATREEIRTRTHRNKE